MLIRSGLMLLAASTFAVAALSLPVLARDTSATTEFSAQFSAPAPDPKAKRAAPPRQAPARAAPVQRAAPRPAPMMRVAPRPAPVMRGPVQRAAPAMRPVQRPANVPRNFVAPSNVPRVVAPRAPVSAAPRIIAAPRQGNRAFTPRGTNSTVVRATRIRSAPLRGIGRTSIQGRNYSVWRNNYRVRRGNGWRTFVALGALGTIAIGAAEYYPYAYIQAPVNYCDGRTEDGCQLVWEDVETVEGDLFPQCVAYCPWQP